VHQALAAYGLGVLYTGNKSDVSRPHEALLDLRKFVEYIGAETMYQQPMQL